MGRKHRYRFCCDEGKSSLFGSLGLFFFFFAWVLLVLKVVVLVFCFEVFALIIVVMKT